MTIAKSKTSTAIALIMIFAMSVSFVAMPSAYAWNDATTAAVNAGMKWDFPDAADYDASSIRLLLWERYQDRIPTWVYGVISPNPVGVGQRVTIVMFNPQVPYGAAAANDVRYEYSVTITTPNGNTVRLPASGTIVSDSTGSAYTDYVPDQVGNYSITIKVHELFYRWYQTATFRNYYGVTLLESTHTYTLVVQEEQVDPIAITIYPLPTEYWTRPIEGQNQEWGQVSSNWLNSAKDRDVGSSQNRFQTEGIAPNSGHILWTKPTEDGGVVGGYDSFSVPGEVFNAGHQYQTRFTNQIIMHGRLYYQEPIYWAGGGGRWVCVDLRTGEEIWANWTMSATPSFGYYYDWDDMNQHGIVNPGWIFSNNFGTAIHPLYGIAAPLSIQGVPSGFEVVGPKGEHLRYVMQNAGTSSKPDWRLYQWNSSKVFTSQNSGTRNASLNSPLGTFDWEVPIPWRNTMTQTPTIRAVIQDDIMLLSLGTLPTAGTTSLTYHNVPTGTLFGVSLKPGDLGRLVWGPTDYEMTYADGSQNLYIRAGEGVFVMQHLPTLTFSGYSMYTGAKLWTSESQAEIATPYGYYTWVSLMNVHGTSIAYGKLFTSGYTGHVFCYDIQDGTLLWKYDAPTYAEIFEYYTLFIGTIADGKIYIGTHEHSADTPLLKGNRIRALDVETGEEVWTMLGWAHPQTMAIADGILIYWNNYDHQIYAVGKGPSSTAASIQNDVTTHGNKVLVTGSVTDISAGTRQHEQAMRFPNGVPAVSDASMSEWMEYVYMQKPRPADTMGVEVVISVLDPNNNCYEVGRTTSDADGFFKLVFEPEVPGEYSVIARFEGSEGYWPSQAVTGLLVDEAPAPPPEATPPPASLADLYFIPAVVGIIIAIVVVGAVLVLLLRKR
jgi:outer membrane protein assembly factor BamB